VLRTPEELVRIGFERSRVVIVNECHSGDKHCARTRAVGRRMLPVANAIGVRHLAMEALVPTFAADANRLRILPSVPAGYLAQPDMRDLIADALALGWTLVAYECDFGAWRGGSHLSLDFGNWRDAEEARNIQKFLSRSAPDVKLLVWCGHSHQRKTPQRYPGLQGGTWIRLGERLRDESGIDPFVIDQSVTVKYWWWRRPARDKKPFAAELRRLGGTAGFLREEDPEERWRTDASADAWVLSLENSLR
jgi:hypothetical protein